MSTVASGDVENPTVGSIPVGSSSVNPSKKWKVISISAILLSAVVVAAALGSTLGRGKDTSANVISNNPAVLTVDEDSSEQANPADVGLTETYKARYLDSNGPIESKVRIIDPSVANGYDSCDDMKDDIINVLNYYVNSVISQELQYSDMYENCDPNDPNGWFPSSSLMPLAKSADPVAVKPEKSKANINDFETNYQVYGVDEADVVKSNGEYVFAAYGDLLYAWNADDGTKGVSITEMPYKKIEVQNCNYYTATSEPVPTGSEDTGATNSTDNLWYPCYQPKPYIVALLLHGERLTAIVSEDNYNLAPTSTESEPKIFSDYSKLTIKVFDISNVPTDGSPLKLLAENGKEIKASYTAAQSRENKATIVVTSNIDLYSLAEDLYRYNTQYCGLNDTEYEKLAVETALNQTKPFMERMLAELQVKMDGTCDSIFQVAAMQSGESTEDAHNGMTFGSFVQVLSFDMASDFTDQIVSPNVAGSFSPSWPIAYAAQDFVAVLSGGSYYNATTTIWDSTTFILGFDISGDTPKPICFAEVPGNTPYNQFSADLYEGHLRVVTTEYFWNETTSTTANSIFVLKVPQSDEGTEMVLTGKTSLEVTIDSVIAVRFMEDKGYVEMYGPSYVYDLSNPADPKILVKLETPGYSSYLEPIKIGGSQFMLGLGSDYNFTSGMQTGLQISLYNISDPANLQEKAVLVEKDAWSNAGYDFKAFRYLEQAQKLIIPKSVYTYTEQGNFDGFSIYDVSLNSIKPSFQISHSSSSDIYSGCWYNAYMPARSFVFNSKITTILSHTVISTDLLTGKQLWTLNLDKSNITDCSSYFMSDVI